MTPTTPRGIPPIFALADRLRFLLLILPGFFPLMLAGCGATTPPVVKPIDAAQYRNFLVASPLLPFWVEGAVQFSFRGQRESGTMILQAVAGPSFRIRLKAPLTGALALEIRFDPEALVVVDYVNETYSSGKNTPANRSHLFQMDLTPREFQVLLTGRVDKAAFLAGGGLRSGRKVTYREGETLHTFRLDEHGLPLEWIRIRKGSPPMRVEFREYREWPAGRGVVLRLPRKVRVYQAGGRSRLTLGIRQFRPGASGGPLPRPEDLPENVRKFRRALLPGGDAP